MGLKYINLPIQIELHYLKLENNLAPDLEGAFAKPVSFEIIIGFH